MFKLFALIVLVWQCLSVQAFKNPIKSSDGSDPFIVSFKHLTTTTWTDIQITRGTTMQELKDATPKVVWSDTTSSRCCNVWAPEIWWYECCSLKFYYTAGVSGTFDDQYLHVLKGSSTNIWDSEWSYENRISIPNRDLWSIDATLMFYGSATYLVYSAWDGAYQCLFIAQMTSSSTVGDAVKISTPTYDWEMVGANVNEGPGKLTFFPALYHGGRTFLTFSASNCAGTGYKLGRLELTGTNPLSASSWTKYSEPIFTSANGNYEPGHNGFFTSEDGTEIWMVYHASSASPGTCDGARYTMVQSISWNSDGTPNLGSPVSESTSLSEPA
ncbi:Arabinanase/levansucrase/invertase [Armillaria luteobubalina]|uniref:Arabinanase/levansucrase/invertase n=1 Tax=Armillaria luteobubalina TaxID=153913 RepID=A0AA39QFH7_9AGAR|nr:Arabinanase/levansucrase/invertase [Armillaria luteobubalina]